MRAASAFAAPDTVAGDYAGRSLAAWEIAAEYFNAEKVVGGMREQAGF